eukprot:1150783-Pelagomonas_calceolata.AAC.5
MLARVTSNSSIHACVNATSANHRPCIRIYIDIISREYKILILRQPGLLEEIRTMSNMCREKKSHEFPSPKVWKGKLVGPGQHGQYNMEGKTGAWRGGIVVDPSALPPLGGLQEAERGSQRLVPLTGPPLTEEQKEVADIEGL